jgi:hypothetical protein
VDPTAFDHLSRTVAAGHSRRRLMGLLSGALAAVIPGRDPDAARRRQRHRHGAHVEGKKGKRRKKKRAATIPLVSPPPASPPPVPPPPPPTSCIEPAEHFCASDEVCVPECPSGKVYDEGSCSCVCAQQQTCCYCRCQNNTFSCFPGVLTEAACKATCGTFCGEDPSVVDISFAGGSGSDAACNFGTDTCDVTCQADTVCGKVDLCMGNVTTCGQGGKCFQPLGGGPTRCGELVLEPRCTTHADCASLGLGAFCAFITGIVCIGGPGSTTYCASPR